MIDRQTDVIRDCTFQILQRYEDHIISSPFLLSNRKNKKKAVNLPAPKQIWSLNQNSTAEQQKDSVHVGGYGKLLTLGDDTIPSASSLQGQLLLIIVAKEESPQPPQKSRKIRMCCW